MEPPTQKPTDNPINSLVFGLFVFLQYASWCIGSVWSYADARSFKENHSWRVSTASISEGHCLWEHQSSKVNSLCGFSLLKCRRPAKKLFTLISEPPTFLEIMCVEENIQFFCLKGDWTLTVFFWGLSKLLLEQGHGVRKVYFFNWFVLAL